MKVYIIKDNYDGRIYEIYANKNTAENVLNSLNVHAVYGYFIQEYDVETS